MRCLVLILTAALSAGALADADDQLLRDARKFVAAEMPDLDWGNDLALVADVDGDKVLDVILVGISNDSFSIVVALATEQGSSHSSIQFSLSNSMQMAACGVPVGWESKPRSERPFNALGAYPPGYEECSDCQEFTLIDDGGCDPINLYWNVASRKIDWWRA